MKCIVAVPARLESTRLPGKVLADIGGKPMIRRVLERCQLAKQASAVVLCTDSHELHKSASDWGFTSFLTGSNCTSGSERIASICEKLVSLGESEAKKTIIINVQGDQPFIDSSTIDKIALSFNSSPSSSVFTPVYRLDSHLIHDPNIVKVLIGEGGRAIYFSRSAIPHVRGVEKDDWGNHTQYWGHIGIYGYRADVLSRWRDLPNSSLEELEKLEQLRMIEAGVPIKTVEVDSNPFSVDTKEQLAEARLMVSRTDIA